MSNDKQPVTRPNHLPLDLGENRVINIPTGMGLLIVFVFVAVTPKNYILRDLMDALRTLPIPPAAKLAVL